jgi:hypothetical protein
VKIARSSANPEFMLRAKAFQQRMHEAQSGYTDAQNAIQVLATNPTDPNASLKVGKYRCLFKGEWRIGLTMLAAGSDPVLKELANEELALPATSPDQVKLGDGWWDAAGKTTGPLKLPMQQRAAFWYRKADADLAGLTKSKVDERLVTLAELDPSRVIDLFAMFDLKRDVVVGKWEASGSGLVSDGSDYARVEFSYQPPEEYDFKVVFERTGGSGDVQSICYEDHHQFSFAIDCWGTGLGFIDIAGHPLPDHNPSFTFSQHGWIVNGRQYTSVVKVRKGDLQAFVNDKLVAGGKTDYTDMSTPT